MYKKKFTDLIIDKKQILKLVQEYPELLEQMDNIDQIERNLLLNLNNQEDLYAKLTISEEELNNLVQKFIDDNYNLSVFQKKYKKEWEKMYKCPASFIYFLGAISFHQSHSNIKTPNYLKDFVQLSE